MSRTSHLFIFTSKYFHVEVKCICMFRALFACTNMGSSAKKLTDINTYTNTTHYSPQILLDKISRNQE